MCDDGFDRDQSPGQRRVDESIALVARRAGIEELRRALYAHVEKLVMEIMPHFDDNLAVAPFIDRFHSIRDSAGEIRYP